MAGGGVNCMRPGGAVDCGVSFNPGHAGMPEQGGGRVASRDKVHDLYIRARMAKSCGSVCVQRLGCALLALTRPADSRHRPVPDAHAKPPLPGPPGPSWSRDPPSIKFRFARCLTLALRPTSARRAPRYVQPVCCAGRVPGHEVQRSRKDACKYLWGDIT